MPRHAVVEFHQLLRITEDALLRVPGFVAHIPVLLYPLLLQRNTPDIRRSHGIGYNPYF